MITVRMVGGAKKSFPAGVVTIHDTGITIHDVLRMLERLKPAGTPSLDTENILVAVNGADSSVHGGRRAVIHDGDTVDIIPVVHGGEMWLDVAGMRVGVWVVPSEAADPDDLRRRFDARIQCINPQYVLDESHLRRILEISVEAERRGLLLTGRIETDIMLRLAGTTQISEAIRLAGTGDCPHAVVVALGPRLDAMSDALSGLSVPLCRQDGVPPCYMDVGVPSGRTLEEMLAERAAVL